VKETFFENFHSASADCPYFDGDMRNIQYLSHFHTEIEVVLVKSGSVEVTCAGNAFKADKGDICIFMPGEIHSFSSPEDNHLYILKLYCRNSVEKTDFSLLRISGNPIKKTDSSCDLLTARIEKLAKEMTEKAPGYAYAASAAAADMIAFILRRLSPSPINPDEHKRHLSEVALLDSVNGLIESRYFESIELEDAAKYCSLSKYYFAHLFKNTVGTTFYEYLTLYRLERAVPLLLDTGKKISEIALDCGFSNIRSFNRAFRRVYKKSPGEYRAERQLGENK